MRYHGKLFGVPVWIYKPESDCPGVEAKSWAGELLLEFALEPLFSGFCWIVSFINPDWEPMYPLLVGPQEEDGE